MAHCNTVCGLWLTVVCSDFLTKLYAFLLHDFRTRFAKKISCFLAVVARCCYANYRVLAACVSDEIACYFWAVTRCCCEMVCFLVGNFRARYPDEISCFLSRYERYVYAILIPFWPWWDALRRFHAFWLPNVIFVRKLCGSKAGDECTFCGGWWKCECVGRPKGLCRRCLIRVASMHDLKSIRMFERTDSTWTCSCDSRSFTRGCWVGGVMYVIWRMCWPSLGCDGIVIGVGCSSAPFFPYALTVNVIGLFFLRQCLVLLPPSTETSVSGMSRKWPIWVPVSQ